MNDFAPLATVARDGLVECTHLGDVAVCDYTGRLLWQAGHPDRRAYFRSACKPLQALPVVLSGAADQFALTETELAVCCASHSGSRAHVLTVAGILEKLGLDETALACGTHMPGDADESRRLIRAGEEPSPLHNNCSGKHAGMLATACALGAPVAGYLAREHPVQQLIHHQVALATGVPESEFQYGTDGCGALTVGVTLRAMATAFARLANPKDMPADFGAAARRVISAMATAPAMVSAPRAFNSDLLDIGNGHLVAKGGAEGLFLVGIVDPRGLGVAVKTADGSFRPMAPVLVPLLRQLGGLSDAAVEALATHAQPQIRNCHGTLVGTVKSVLALTEGE